MASDRIFSWAKFYTEFAGRLLEHKSDRRELVAKVRDVCNNLSYNYLDNSGTANPDTGLPDICPFTTMGTFNRNISTTNRRAIASELALFLGVTEPVPDTFSGIPTLNNQNSVVFWNLRDVGPLWRVFEDAIILAEADNEDTRQSFLDSYGRIFEGRGIGRNLTIGLFWARPDRFLPLDSSSENYISGSLGVTPRGHVPLPGSEYLELTDQLKRRFGESGSPVHSFRELAMAAYETPSSESNSSVCLVRAGREGNADGTPERVRRYWWVNQGGTHREEVEGGYLWAPVKSKRGELAHHRSMADLQVGDTIFHYWESRIQAVSSVTEAAVNAPIPGELTSQGWQRDGRRARVQVKMLSDPVSLEDIPLEWRLEGDSFTRKGSVNQGYLYPVSEDFVIRLSGRFPQIAECVSIDRGVQCGGAIAYIEPNFETIRSRIETEGLVVSDRTLRRFHLSLRSRGFVILSGISGTGKTWLAQAYARAVGGRELLVPVAPNWTTNEDLLGYLNPISGVYHDTAFSKFLREAALEWETAGEEEREPVPHYLVLDEMNLARVEYYFATFLSALEVRQREETARVQLGEDVVLLTPNLRFVGTVNVDETTHGFADKVYDRAQLVELEAPREAIERHLADSPLTETLLSAWEALHEVAPFAFRVVDDIRDYVEAAEALGVEVEAALDEQMLQKLLPKVHGIDPRIEQALTGFIELCGDRFPLSADKARRMRIRFNEHGSASYFA